MDENDRERTNENDKEINWDELCALHTHSFNLLKSQKTKMQASFFSSVSLFLLNFRRFHTAIEVIHVVIFVMRSVADWVIQFFVPFL